MKPVNYNSYKIIADYLLKNQETWLITGVAGFVGSNLLEVLLRLNQKVIGFDNLSTGYMSNIDSVKNSVDFNQWENFEFVIGDLREIDSCRSVVKNVKHVLHQAALGSVPRSIDNPVATNETNVNGFLNMLVASKDSAVESFTYASSSSVYGDSTRLPKIEHEIGMQLSPYAVTKLSNELYSNVFHNIYGFSSTGFRYFNVFGKRQDPNGSYAAVIPKWCGKIINGEDIEINGDGETTRDFCYIENVVRANIMSAMTMKKRIGSRVYNVAIGEQTSLIELANLLISEFRARGVNAKTRITHGEFRSGDVRHSLADCSKIVNEIGYEPSFKIGEGIGLTVEWFLEKSRENI